MSIVRYRNRPASLFADMEPLTNRLARLMDESMLLADRSETAARGWLPRVDVEESDDAMILTADLPGFDPEQVDIQVENQVLTLTGTRESTREDRTPAEGETGTEMSEAPANGRRVHLRERSWGSFARSFTLPRTIKAEEISASFDRGVLTVHMPKAAEARSRRIEIRTTA
jgi:HSP20 family protein